MRVGLSTAVVTDASFHITRRVRSVFTSAGYIVYYNPPAYFRAHHHPLPNHLISGTEITYSLAKADVVAIPTSFLCAKIFFGTNTTGGFFFFFLI